MKRDLVRLLLPEPLSGNSERACLSSGFPLNAVAPSFLRSPPSLDLTLNDDHSGGDVSKDKMHTFSSQ